MKRRPARRAPTVSETSCLELYDVKAALQGFREIIRQNVPVSVGQVSRVDVVLEVGALTETVTVAVAI